ncbi:hypothetical protein Lbir_0633 [Legionella birminghamensis]|uniref:Ran GTPase-activating protein (RanGAP) involved in mRNA processing and transport n=1 Tax=Legionella birminghamensis TaxID=28083 RepID=A0A378IHT5_9GAMM|nr:hypothetical protein [Legionella birminghamensis]KTC74843.1 hypothetical protein Lbir_0633 [Legionella birminghamensis]STX31744.1 Ran GTPase-activating protein (RanGAP) involved in mRNA processing and transport [Legionella birminghamensis]
MDYATLLHEIKSATVEHPLKTISFFQQPVNTELMKSILSLLNDVPLASNFRFSFYDCQVTDESLRPLLEFLTSANCPKEINLSLSKNRITHNSTTLLAKTLTNSVSSSININLDSNALLDESIATFAQHFKPNKGLTRLWLNFGNNHLTVESAAHLSQIIASTNSLSEFRLNVQSNTITDAGAKSIIDAMTPDMANNFNLCLASNDLSSETTQHLLTKLRAFQGNQTIALNLAQNNLGDTGFNHMLELLTAKTCRARFEHIYLSDCSITSDSIKPLATSINDGLLPGSLCLDLQDNELNLSLQLLADALVSPDCPKNLMLYMGSERNRQRDPEHHNPCLLDEAAVKQFIDTFKAHSPAIGLYLNVGKSGSEEQREELKKLCRETALNAQRCANVWMGYCQEKSQFEVLPPEIIAQVFSFVASSAPKRPFSFFTMVTNGYNRIKKISDSSLSDTCTTEETSHTPSVS